MHELTMQDSITPEQLEPNIKELLKVLISQVDKKIHKLYITK